MRIMNILQTLIKIFLMRAPLEAQLIATRRCNLKCGYCTEFDSISRPIPIDVLKVRIDALHRLHVANITILGGEPLLHPQIDEIVSYANRKSQVLIFTNGLLLTKNINERINNSGLNKMQVSFYTLRPDMSGYIQKS